MKKIKKNKQEFVTTYFHWVSLDEQKEKVERLENITNKYKQKK